MPRDELMLERISCPICNAACSLLDVVDFNKSCEELRGKFLGLSGVPCYYTLCGGCGFCFAPEFAAWTPEQFEEKIYNDEYVLVDPEYIEIRPRANAASLVSIFGDRAHAIRHLDYGGGNGLLSSLLRESRWQSVSYDPFADKTVSIDQLGKFDLITAFEVFEHVPDPQRVMSDFGSLIAPDGMVMFSTLLSDGNIHRNQRINWWYASPRNGHISLFSKSSLAALARNNGVNYASFSEGFHVFFTQVPPWAAHIIHIKGQQKPGLA
jgi:SAM-dependent methyltransferase